MTARQELERREGDRFRCRASVARFGTKPAFKGPPIPTILLYNVVDAITGQILTDHLWFTTGKWSQGLGVGDIFEFEARVGDYTKGYKGRRDVDGAPVSRDWKLQRPTKITILTRGRSAAS